jgi:tripartite-type tricarboxylate transporter receptor subunit TctC
LYRELAGIMRQPDIQEQFTQAGLEAIATTPDAFAAEVKDATARWPQVVKSLGIRSP